MTLAKRQQLESLWNAAYSSYNSIQSPFHWTNGHPHDVAVRIGSGMIISAGENGISHEEYRKIAQVTYRNKIRYGALYTARLDNRERFVQIGKRFFDRKWIE